MFFVKTSDAGIYFVWWNGILVKYIVFCLFDYLLVCLFVCNLGELCTHVFCMVEWLPVCLFVVFVCLQHLFVAIFVLRYLLL